MDITCYLPPNGSVVEFWSLPLDGITLFVVDLDVRSAPLTPQVIPFAVSSLWVLIGCGQVVVMTLSWVFACSTVVVELHPTAPAVLVPLSPGLLRLCLGLGLYDWTWGDALVPIGGLQGGYQCFG